ncbi:MAG: intracellular multiplication protein IcmO [Colwellia sp.]|jgi:intracellular multiplication protein IcmO
MRTDSSPSDRHNILTKDRYVDTRGEGKKLLDQIKRTATSQILVLMCLVGLILAPYLFWLFFLIITLVSLIPILSKSNKVLPIKLPIELKNKYKDYHAPLPGRLSYKKASGTVFLGNIRQRNLEMWQEGEDLLTHQLVIGSTGSGKTETLVSQAGAVAFCLGGGTFYLDPKAGNLLLIQFAALCRIFGRIDDFRVMNYKNGGVVILEKHYAKGTNSFNPFSLGTDKAIFQILGGLLPADAGQNQSFLNSAIEMMKAVLPTFCELRDRGYIQLTPGLIADYINIKHLADLLISGKVYIPNQDEKIEVEISKKSLRPLGMYFDSLQYDRNVDPAEQSDSVKRSFGYAKQYYGEPLSNLAANYGHMYDKELPEISLEDVIYNNRIMLTLMPSLENPPAEQKNLGKIALSTAKQAMSLGLGSKTQGSFSDIIHNLPIDKKIPFLITADEYAEVAVPGFAVAATQGRSIGVCVTFGSQDLDGLIRADKDEAGMIFSNTLNKYLMRTIDPETTWQKFKSLASTIAVAESGNFKEGKLLGAYKKQIEANIKEVDRLHFNDVSSQIEGEAYFFERGNMHKMNTFYHGLSEEDLESIVPHFRYNQLIPVLAPCEKDLSAIKCIIDKTNHLLVASPADYLPLNMTCKFPDQIMNNRDHSLFIQTIKECDEKNQQKDSLNSLESGTLQAATTEAETPDNKVNTITTEMSGAMGQPEAQETVNFGDTQCDAGNIKESNSIAKDMAQSLLMLADEGDKELTEKTEKDLLLTHWMYQNTENNNKESIRSKIASRLNDINKIMMGDESKADEENKRHVEDVIGGLPYTSKPKVTPKDEDSTLMWDNVEMLT